LTLLLAAAGLLWLGVAHIEGSGLPSRTLDGCGVVYEIWHGKV
jgi:hypothetical protein